MCTMATHLLVWPIVLTLHLSPVTPPSRPSNDTRHAIPYVLTELSPRALPCFVLPGMCVDVWCFVLPLSLAFFLDLGLTGVVQRAWLWSGSARSATVGMSPCTATLTPTATPGSWPWAISPGAKAPTRTPWLWPPVLAGEDETNICILVQKCGSLLSYRFLSVRASKRSPT